MTSFADFLSQFVYEPGLLQIDTGSVFDHAYYAYEEQGLIDHSRFDKLDCYFGPAMRSQAGTEKEHVLGTQVLWVDIDNLNKPQVTLPPSLVVFSGHGWHFYWKLDAPINDITLIEKLNQILIADIPTADKACWNCNRILRIPGSTNNKEKDAPVLVELKEFHPGFQYTTDDIKALERLAPKTRHKIRTGDKRGFRSRSERDWSIITDLVTAGATDELITFLFAHQPCGDKAQENDHYLKHTLETIRAKQPEEQQEIESKGDIFPGSDGFYVQGRKGASRISTFIIHPKLLLEGTRFNASDAIVGDVEAEGFTWPDVTFSRTAFQSVSKMDAETPVVAWQWLGRDDDVRRLLPYLLTLLKAQGLPKVAATGTMGLHNINDQWIFVGNEQSLSHGDFWKGWEAPVCWLPTKREHAKLDLQIAEDNDFSEWAQRVVRVNAPGVVWPMIGWFTAACIKPWLEEQHYRYPILNVAGTKGSGKTTLIQRVFMPMIGHTDPRSYDANTTRFVILTLLGSSNAIPVTFSEFRYESAVNFIRFVLLSYDTGHDPRGRGDQTTVDYPLSAPMSIDGEDLLEDPAARERIVVAHLQPKTVEEGSDAYQAFMELRDGIHPATGGFLIRHILKALASGHLKELLAHSREQLFKMFPGKLPDRVRNNHIVAYLGVLLWCEAFKIDPPGADCMRVSISSVFNLETGRGRTLVDSLVEDIVNAVAQGTVMIPTVYDANDNILWFQLAPAHSWWISSRRRQGRGALERDAIRTQFREAAYAVAPQVKNDAWMYGINLQAAVDNGLDIPAKLSERTFVMRF